MKWRGVTFNIDFFGGGHGGEAGLGLNLFGVVNETNQSYLLLAKTKV